MVSKYQFDFLSGTILAGDGLVDPIKATTRLERVEARVPDLANYRNRKGCYALIVQAFCDAHGKFLYFETRWSGSTNALVVRGIMLILFVSFLFLFIFLLMITLYCIIVYITLHCIP